MTGDPQPIPMHEGFDWYWPSHLNDEEWIAGGRYPDDDDRRPPSTCDDFRGPILARRKPPEPWTPKVGDRVQEGGGVWTGTVKAVEGPACWVLYDGANNPVTAHVAKLAPLQEADQ